MPSTYEKRKEAWDRKRAQVKLEQEQAAAVAVAPAVVPDPDFPDELPPVPPSMVLEVAVPTKVESVVAEAKVALAAKKATKAAVVASAKDAVKVRYRDDALAPAEVISKETPETRVRPVVSATAAFAAWLASPMGYECTDPRAPSDPTRKRVDLEDRLRKAFIAGVMAGMEVVKG